MEQLALQVSTHMEEHVRITRIVNRWGKKGLPVFLPYALTAALARIRRGGVDAVCLADASLAPLGAALKRMTGVAVVSTVHGLDVTWRNRAYQAVVPPSLRQLDLVLPNSRETERVLREHVGKLPPSQVVPLGVNPLPAPSQRDIEAFRRSCGIEPGQRLLLTTGRLIERKGVAWFARHVMPKLPQDAVYVVIGEGPQRSVITSAARAAGVANRVRLAGRVSDVTLAAAYQCADVFVMPNVPVSGDIEGFGLVALEAASSGVPVVAAKLDGITEAVHHKRNGLLVRPRDAAAMAAAVKSILDLPENARASLGLSHAHYTKREYSWAKTAERYAEAITPLVNTTEPGLRKAA
jgi:glycosyltransferase involved in cell wall biosynthesis